MTPLVECRGLSFAYAPRGAGADVFAIRDLSFDVKPGETFGIIGPNASGKTTLVRLLSKVVEPSTGRVLLDGADVAKLSRAAVARQVAVVPQGLRMLVGPDNRVVIPAALLGGGAFLLVADTLARNLIAPAELSVGVITSFCGAPFFIYLLRARATDPPL